MGKKVGFWHAYSGATHIHTTASDGTKPIEEVIAIGQSAGLDFMMFCDHMGLTNRDNGCEGLYDKTLVLIGYEHNDKIDHSHYLLFDSPGIYQIEMSPSEYVAAGVKDGAFGIVAHPDEIRDRLKKFPPYPWDDWSASGFDGMELWNQMSEWMERLTKTNRVTMSFSPRKSMIGPTARILKKWDELSMNGKCVGIAGVDAHAFPVRLGPFTIRIFPYKVHFKSLRTHVLLPTPMSGEFKTAKKQLFDALRDCRVFFSNMRWGEADDFEFYGVSGAHSVTCGGELPLTDDARLIVRLPSRASIKLIHNGSCTLESEGKNLEYAPVKSGIYRVEAWKRNRGWIFSNHIRINNESTKSLSDEL
jgi:hypothetical protein